MFMNRWLLIVVLLSFFFGPLFPGAVAGQESVDILIVHGSVITMDPDRRVIEDGAVAILADRIVAVGRAEELQGSI